MRHLFYCVQTELFHVNNSANLRTAFEVFLECGDYQLPVNEDLWVLVKDESGVLWSASVKVNSFGVHEEDRYPGLWILRDDGNRDHGVVEVFPSLANDNDEAMFELALEKLEMQNMILEEGV